MQKMKIIEKIREYGKYLTPEAVKSMILTEFGISEQIYKNMLKAFHTEVKTQVELANIDCENILNIDHLIEVLAQLKRQHKKRFVRVSIKGKLKVIGAGSISE